MTSLNLFKGCPYNCRYPLNQVKWFLHGIKCSYQRATKGYCDRDLWDLNDYYANIISRTTEELSKRHMGYPNDDVGSEGWEDILKKISTYFDSTHEENYDTPVADSIYKDKSWNKVSDDELKKILKEDNEIQESMQKNLHLGLELLEKWWFNLWD